MAERKKTGNKVGPCSIEGCGKVGPLTRTWCHMHYRRYRKNGDPGPAIQLRAPNNATPQQLLDYWGWDVKDSGCWEARGFRNEDGYVLFSTSYRKISAHRASFIVHYGEIPAGREICHTCDNPACINPEHLYAGTHSENMLDRSKRQRDPRMVLTPDKVRVIRVLDKCGETKKVISEQLGVSPDVVHQVLNGNNWSWVED